MDSIWVLERCWESWHALTGQTIGGILAAISFRIAAHSETVALSRAAALAAIAAEPAAQGSIIQRARAR